jgi:hypothetical protein
MKAFFLAMFFSTPWANIIIHNEKLQDLAVLLKNSAGESHYGRVASRWLADLRVHSLNLGKESWKISTIYELQSLKFA